MRRVLAAIVLVAACSGGPTPTPTGSTCPSDNTLTYDDFGAPFMHDFCIRCHATNLSGNDRHGAPVVYNFDTEQGIRFFPDKIDEYAAAGPNAINRIMPNDVVAVPTDDQRRQLGQWLACLVAGRGDSDAGVPDAAP